MSTISSNPTEDIIKINEIYWGLVYSGEHDANQKHRNLYDLGIESYNLDTKLAGIKPDDFQYIVDNSGHILEIINRGSSFESLLQLAKTNPREFRKQTATHGNTPVYIQRIVKRPPANIQVGGSVTGKDVAISPKSPRSPSPPPKPLPTRKSSLPMPSVLKKEGAGRRASLLPGQGITFKDGFKFEPEEKHQDELPDNVVSATSAVAGLLKGKGRRI